MFPIAVLWESQIFLQCYSELNIYNCIITLERGLHIKTQTSDEFEILLHSSLLVAYELSEEY